MNSIHILPSPTRTWQALSVAPVEFLRKKTRLPAPNPQQPQPRPLRFKWPTLPRKLQAKSRKSSCGSRLFSKLRGIRKYSRPNKYIMPQLAMGNLATTTATATTELYQSIRAHACNSLSLRRARLRRARWRLQHHCLNPKRVFALAASVISNCRREASNRLGEEQTMEPRNPMVLQSPLPRQAAQYR